MMEPGFYCMDCMDAMRQFPDKFFDLAIVDPPYGISVASHANGALVGGGGRPFGGKKKQSSVYAPARSNHTNQHFITPSPTTVHRTKVISQSCGACPDAALSGAGISCWTIWARQAA